MKKMKEKKHSVAFTLSHLNYFNHPNFQGALQAPRRPKAERFAEVKQLDWKMVWAFGIRKMQKLGLKHTILGCVHMYVSSNAVTTQEGKTRDIICNNTFNHFDKIPLWDWYFWDFVMSSLRDRACFITQLWTTPAPRPVSPMKQTPACTYRIAMPTIWATRGSNHSCNHLLSTYCPPVTLLVNSHSLLDNLPQSTSAC